MATKKDPRLTEPLQGDGPGAYLRKAREEANMSVDKVASALLLHTATVEALEADAYERLPAPTFVRGYFRGYARVLGLPSKPVLEMYDRQGFEPPPLATDVTEPEQAHTSDTAVRLVTYAVAVVLALLVGLWWHSQEDGGFGIAGDLFDRSPETDQDPSALAAGESGTTPDEGEAGGRIRRLAVRSGGRAAAGRRDPVSSARRGRGIRRRDAASARRFARRRPRGGVGVRRRRDAASTGHAARRRGVGGDGIRHGGGPGEIVEVESTPDGTEAEGESVAAAPLAPPGDEGSAEAAPVEVAAAGNIAEAGSAPSEPPAPEAAANREASASQEPQSGTVAGLDRTTGTVPVSGTSPAGADGEETAAVTTDTDPGSGAATGEAGLVLEFVHESWVEVYDRERTRLFFGLVQPGRALSFDGPQPFDVLLGYGKDVRVSIDGRAFDHTPFLKHGVARFSVGTDPDDGTDVAETATTSEPDTDDAPAPESEPEVRGG